MYPEWSDSLWRMKNGWQGSDFIHDRKSRGPRIIRYFFDKKSEILIGVVKFGVKSESHAGLCHGGSMTAVLDDVLGHTAFVVNRKPWSGATVAVNCVLKKPVLIGSVMKVWGKVRERKGRKLLIDGALEAEDGTIHATLDGVTIECSKEQLLGK